MLIWDAGRRGYRKGRGKVLREWVTALSILAATLVILVLACCIYDGR